MRVSWIAAVAALALLAQPVAAQQANNAGLRIVVIEGEDAVNIIQQKTAVAPIVEVRDRNNLPVSGATVTFSIGQGASFGGQSTLTVVTNAAGQATATGLSPTAAGAIQIQATATFQGQTAIATIAQSNVLTAAEVATTTTAGAGGTGGGTGGGSGAAAGAGGGAGGGLSGATLGIIGGAVAGGAVVATKAAGGGGSDSSSTSSTTPGGTTSTTPTGTTPTTPGPSPQPTSASFSGPLDGTISGTSTITISGAPTESCSITVRDRGTVTLRLTQSGGRNTGTLTINLTQSLASTSCSSLGSLGVSDVPYTWSADVSGAGNSIGLRQEFRDSGSQEGASWSTVYIIEFNGTISGGAVTGTITHSGTVDVRGDGFSSRLTLTGSFPLTLR